jgi:hypothetical protein
MRLASFRFLSCWPIAGLVADMSTYQNLETRPALALMRSMEQRGQALVLGIQLPHSMI